MMEIRGCVKYVKGVFIDGYVQPFYAIDPTNAMAERRAMDELT
jgi:hypothetical protein